MVGWLAGWYSHNAQSFAASGAPCVWAPRYQNATRICLLQVVVSDGERTGAAGDLGVQAVGVPIRWVAACAGGCNMHGTHVKTQVRAEALLQAHAQEHKGRGAAAAAAATQHVSEHGKV